MFRIFLLGNGIDRGKGHQVRQEPLVGDPGGDPGAGLEAELGHHVLEVLADGLLGNGELGRDLPIGESARDQAGDLGFAPGQ